MFFPDDFHVTVDAEQGALRVSVRAGENRIDEWWVTAGEVRSILESPNNGIWRGEGSLRVRIKPPGGLVALYDDADNRTIVRVAEPSVRLLLAQLRAALSELGDCAVPPPKPYDGPSATVDLSSLEALVRDEIRAGFSALRAEIGDMIRAEMKGISVAPAPATASPTTESSMPVFIPSGAGKDLGGEITVKPRVEDGDGVSESLRAFKAAKEQK